MRRAFSFAEVMFAVVILGIGFIMVAAVFPVAIQQTQTTSEENIAAALARQAANTVSQLPSTLLNPAYNATAAAGTPASIQTELLFPPTVKNYILGTDNTGSGIAVAPPAIVVPFTGNQWDLLKANLILPSDPRYGYVLFYKRENGSSAAQLIVVATIVRNRGSYDSSDIKNYFQNGTLTTVPSDLKAVAVTKAANPNSFGPTVICPDAVTGLTGNVPEGSYIEIPIQTPVASPMGRSYSLGRQINTTGGQGYELNPGGSLELTAGSSGLWGTTVAPNGTTPPTAPVMDAVASNGNAYLTATLQPSVAYATLTTTAAAPAGIISIDTSAGDFPISPPITPVPSPSQVAAPGAFVIIGDDYPMGSAYGNGAPQDYVLPDNVPGTVHPFSVGALNGRIFRLGAAVPGAPGNFYLDPAYGMRQPTGGGNSPDVVPTIAGGPPAKVYIIGIGRTDPNQAGNNPSYSGAAQDIGVFTSYFQVQ